MISKKQRRHDGRKVTKIYNPKELPYEETKWDDWGERRDGLRGYDDKTKIRNKDMNFSDTLEVERYNKKNKKLLKRRMLRKAEK